MDTLILLYLIRIFELSLGDLSPVDDQSEVVDLGVSIDMVDESLNVVDVFDVLIHIGDVVVGLHHFPDKIGVVNFLGLVAGGDFLPAHNLDTSVFVPAEECEALWEHSDGVALDEVPSRLTVGQSIEVLGPSLVSDSWGTEGNNLDAVKDLVVLKVNEREASQCSSKGNTGDVQLVDTSLVLDLQQVPSDISSNSVPHFVVGSLDFALLASVFVGFLEWIKKILPKVESIGSVPESKDNKLWIDTQDSLDFSLGVVDVVSMKGFVGVIACGTDPQFEILRSSDNE